MTLLLAAQSGPAAADIIVWRDGSGVSHYTNDISNVPTEYQDEAITVAKDWARAVPSVEPVPADAPDPVPAVAGAAAPANQDAYNAAYVAGFRAGAQADPAGGVTGSAMQNAEVPRPSPRGPRPAPRHDGRAAIARDPFPPAEPAPFVQEPAGPPPIAER